MALWPLISELFVTFALSACLLFRYGNWSSHNVFTTISVFVAWFFSFIVIFILPLDISTTAYFQCLHKRANSTIDLHNNTNVTILPTPLSIAVTLDTFLPLNNTSSIATSNVTTVTPIEPVTTTTVNPIPEIVCIEPWSLVAGDVLPALWRVVYWTSQVLTWLILPLLQSYCMAGDFTVLRKLKSSFVENLIFYGIGAVTFLFFLVYVAIHRPLNMEYLKVVCITASNTWGLLLLSVLLGYGLVEIPKSVYEASKQNRKLNYLYFKVAKLSAEKVEAEEKLEDALDQIQHTYEAVLTNHPHLKKYMDIILNKCPSHWVNQLIVRFSDLEQRGPSYSPRTVTYSEADLVRLHKNILKSSQAFHRTQLQWEYLIEKVLEWEDVAKNQMNPSRMFKRSIEDQNNKATTWTSIKSKLYTPKIEWYWKCQIRSPLYKFIGVILAIFSFFVVWSELTFSIKNPNLSVFSVLHDAARRRESYFIIEILSISSIAYLCVCTYYTVFKIRIFNYYYLASHHQTDEYSLIFCGMLLCRLTPPLCLNFLSLMHLDSHVVKTSDGQETAFTGIMGHMDVIEFIAGGFNIYLPIVMCLFCLATFLEIGSRFLHFMGIEQFVVDDEMTADLIKDGTELVRRERNKRTKQIDGRTRWLTGTSREVNSSSSPTSSHPSNLSNRTTGTSGSTNNFMSSSSYNAPRTYGHSINDTSSVNVLRSTSRSEHLLQTGESSARIELLDDSDSVLSYSTIQQHQPNRNIFDDL